MASVAPSWHRHVHMPHPAPWGSPPAPLTSQPAAFTLGPAWELTGAASSKADLAGRWEGQSLWGHPFPSSSWPAPSPESRPRALEGQNKAEFRSEQPPGSSHLHHGLPISPGEVAGSSLPRPTCLCLLSFGGGGGGSDLKGAGPATSLPWVPPCPVPATPGNGMKACMQAPWGSCLRRQMPSSCSCSPITLCGRLSPALISPCVHFFPGQKTRLVEAGPAVLPLEGPRVGFLRLPGQTQASGTGGGGGGTD